MNTVRNLERRITRLENVLIELALHPHRCKYIYLTDLKQALTNRKVLKTKLVRNENK